MPLARHNRLIFIDERGSGKSEKLEDPSGYTVENMVEDVEAVRQGLKLGKISLLGHSFGGVLAQAYALKYQKNLTHLILCSTFYSTSEMNRVFQKQLDSMDPATRRKIEALEKDGLFDKGNLGKKAATPPITWSLPGATATSPTYTSGVPTRITTPLPTARCPGISTARCGARMASSSSTAI